MPNCDFFGSIEDHAEILEWLFAEKSCRVFELYSDFESPLREFTSAEAVLSRFRRTHVGGKQWDAVYLNLYVLDSGPPFVASRVKLNPASCDGATYRFAAHGLGMVQLYLSSIRKGRLENSHTNHFSSKGAAKWAPLATDSGQASREWDFRKITSFSSMLNRQIRKKAVAKIGSRSVLTGAFALWEDEIPLSYHPRGALRVVRPKH